MSTSSNNNSSGSILGKVAAHEAHLKSTIEAAQAEAKAIVEQARIEANKHLLAEEARMNEDVARIRRDGEAARQKRFQETVTAAERRLDGLREEVSKKIDPMAREILGLFLPKRGGAA